MGRDGHQCLQHRCRQVTRRSGAHEALDARVRGQGGGSQGIAVTTLHQGGEPAQQVEVGQLGRRRREPRVHDLRLEAGNQTQPEPRTGPGGPPTRRARPRPGRIVFVRLESAQPMARPASRQPPAQLFGQRVRDRRLRLGLSQELLAQRSGLHRTYIGSLERGERNVALLNIVRLADALGTDPAELVGGLKP